MVSERVEVTGRYGRIVPRPGTDPSLVPAGALGGGVSFYPRKQNLKLQEDDFHLDGNDGVAGATRCGFSSSCSSSNTQAAWCCVLAHTLAIRRPAPHTTRGLSLRRGSPMIRASACPVGHAEELGQPDSTAD
jgi:hypothetical protein